ncbi:hypothetical protein ABK040_008562 [Willaertia magna]
MPLLSIFGGNKNNTFRPKKSHGGKRKELHKLAKATLGSGDLSQAVKLPAGEDLNEWLAVHTVDFFNTTNLLYGSISEFCTNTTCPVMNAGVEFEYLWMNPEDNITKPIRVSAPEYMEYLMSWIEMKINNETVFPPSPNTPFPTNFKSEVKQIFKRLFRVYAHIYHSHPEDIKKIHAEPHLNTAFKHFCMFVFEFDLISKKEFEPCKDVMLNLLPASYHSKITK